MIKGFFSLIFLIAVMFVAVQGVRIIGSTMRSELAVALFSAVATLVGMAIVRWGFGQIDWLVLAIACPACCYYLYNEGMDETE